MVKDPKKIRNYRRLRRKAKRLRRRRAFFRFIFYKIFPFAFLRVIFEFIFKKYGWVTLVVFLLGSFYNAGNQFSSEQYLKLKESEIELRRTKQELKRLQRFNDEQGLTIKNLQKEIFEWSQEYNKLNRIQEQESEKFKDTIQQLNQTVQQFEKNTEDLNQKNKKLELKLISLKRRFTT